MSLFRLARKQPILQKMHLSFNKNHAKIFYFIALISANSLKGPDRVDTKWRFQFFAKDDYRFLLDVIIAIIATFFAKAIIAISRLSLSISLE
jgi:hypothetical protein